jgi:signal transducing adaptor molecule
MKALTDGCQTTHQQVKSKILERIAEWSKMFSSIPELGIMEQAYMKLKSQSMSTSGAAG